MKMVQERPEVRNGWNVITLWCTCEQIFHFTVEETEAWRLLRCLSFRQLVCDGTGFEPRKGGYRSQALNSRPCPPPSSSHIFAPLSMDKTCHLLLTNRIGQSWGDVTPQMMLERIVVSVPPGDTLLRWFWSASGPRGKNWRQPPIKKASPKRNLVSLDFTTKPASRNDLSNVYWVLKAHTC